MSESMEKDLQQQVMAAQQERRPLCVEGGGSKAFYGGEPVGTVLSVAPHKGVIHYDPTELVVTVRAGTELGDLEDLLATKNQMLGFEPPGFAARSTIGGAIATGLCGPRRPWGGSARDAVLGVKVLTGKGEILRFGGQVMKNVAGFDVSRLMTGAMGTLGVLLEVSMRVSPRPQKEITLVLDQPQQAEAIATMNQLACRPLPISAAAWHEGQTRIRLSGSEKGVDTAAAEVGGDPDSLGSRFWMQLRDHELPFFDSAETLYRVSVAPAGELSFLGSPQILDWGGAQRWLFCSEQREVLEKVVRGQGGHVAAFRNGDRSQPVFQSLDPVVKSLHLRLKQAFDPDAILNPGRLYPDF